MLDRARARNAHSVGGLRWATAFALSIASLAVAPSPSDAASADKSTVSYRWVDDQGVVHYGDRIPPQYAQKEQAVLNSQGVEVRRLEAQKTPEEIAAAAHAEEELLRQKQHDTFLMTTYTSVKDIEALRDVRLDQLRGQRAAAVQYIESLNSHLGALESRAKLFRPYSPRPDAHRMPDDLAEDLVRTMKELRAESDLLQSKSAEEGVVHAQFQADIDRFQALHGKSGNGN